jgi:hypothetical protein
MRSMITANAVLKRICQRVHTDVTATATAAAAVRLFFCGLQPTQDLKHTMAGLLRLHMSLSNEALGDEQVLAVYPTTIRRYACWDACMCVYLTCCHLRGHIA